MVGAPRGAGEEMAIDTVTATAIEVEIAGTTTFAGGDGDI